MSDGGGNEVTLDVLTALSRSGLLFGGFADDEGKSPTLWANLHERLGPLLFRWRTGCLEENVINAVPPEKLDALIGGPDDDARGWRLRTLAMRLASEEKDFETIKTKAGERLRALIIEAATGKVPPERNEDAKSFKKQSQDWFKSVSGGRELTDKVFLLGLWPKFKDQLMPFLNAVRKAVGLPGIAELPLE